MGKEGENLGDLLQDFDADPPLADLQAFIADPRAQAAALLGKATTRVVYDMGRYQRAAQPPFAATLARETHFHDPGGAQTRILISFSYSDGFGREIQKKIQAEPGDAPQRQADVPLPTGDIHPGDLVRDADDKPVQGHTQRRWAGTGRTVFNNKDKPVRQYEPFFSVTHLYEPEREMTDTGVSLVLFYDPAERVVATLHPNHTYEKIVFDPWRQTTYDVNDTVAASAAQTGDPRTDEDIEGYVREYFKTQPNTWQTWHAQRIGNQMGPIERDAAQKAAAHADTPTVAHFDALGRPFLTLTDNGSDPALPGQHQHFATRVELDIEGDQRAVIDAEDRVVMRYDYDLLGNVIHQASMEAGERWMLNDVTGKAIRAWDSRRFVRRMTYDELRRPLGLFVSDNGTPEFLAEKTEYGESKPDPEASNHRGKVWKVYDGAGIVTSVLYNFKGNLREGQRDLLPDYKQAVNWLLNPAANDGSFSSSTTYDALNRPLTVTSPDGSVYRPTFNEANLLDKVDVNLRGEQENEQPKWTPFVTNINYNAKGQRELIAYANGAQTTYEYDSLTFRLTHLKTTRPSNPDVTVSQLFQNATVVQDLRYTYDPAGNITRIEDAALKTVFHNGQQVEPVCSYTYDAIYRMIEASGREHIGQTAHNVNSQNRRDYDFVGHVHFIAQPNDLQALRTYTERYEYDAVGNLDVMRHTANGGSWTRRYDYEEESLIEPGKQSNRLTRTTVGNSFNHIETYTYTDAQGNDVQGCMTAINSMKMAWDFEDQLQQVDLGGGGMAYYVYDAAGQRVRKVLENENGTRAEERLFLGNFEVYRKHTGANAGLVRETLHIMDDKQRIALVETRNDVNDGTAKQIIRFQFGNHLGSASVELDNDGALISHEEYHPYGTTTFQAGRSAAEVSLKRYRFTGKERDDESGLSYHGARYYTPWLGRWVSCDPIGIEDGINVYRFSQDNPIVFVDLDGQQSRPAAEDEVADPTKFDGTYEWEEGHWYYTDRDLNRWMLVDKYGWKWEAGWEKLEGQRYAWVGEYRWTVVGREWIDVTEEIHVEGSAPKEEDDGWGSSLIDFGASFLGPGKVRWLYRGYQFVQNLRETGDPVQSLQNVTVNAATDKIVDKTVATVGKVANKVAKKKTTSGSEPRGGDTPPGPRASSGVLVKKFGGKVPVPKGTHFALGRSETLEEFAESKGAVSIFGAYDRKYFSAAADPDIFKNQFGELVDTFIQNGGRIKFNVTGMVGGVESVTSWELQQILRSGTWRAKTDFFENGRQLTGRRLERRLAPWR
jgi:RHS repeat-associated protein